MAQSQCSEESGCDISVSEDSDSEFVPDTDSSESDSCQTSISVAPLRLPRLESENNVNDSNKIGKVKQTSDFSGTAALPSNLNIKGSLGIDKQYKRNCCYYCDKVVTRIGRHLLNVHAGEKEIISIASEHKEKVEKKLKELRYKGNYRYNVECIRKGEGNLIVMRSPRCQKDPSKYLPCPYCYGFLCSREMSKHCKVCQFRPPKFTVSSPTESAKLLLLPHLQVTASEELKKDVLMKMRDDTVKSTILSDHLILAFGNTQLSKQRASEGEKFSYLSYRIRILGKLRLECEKLTGNNLPLLKLLQPINFDLVVKSVQKMTMGKDSPKSLGLKIGHAVRKCCEIARCMAIKTGDEEQKCHAENFRTLMESEYSDVVSSSLLREIYDTKLNKDTVLPITSDLVRLSRFITDSLQNAMKEMVTVPGETSYFKLSKLTLCKIIFFNKRRGGEASRMTVSDFVNRPNWSARHNEDIYNSLSELEKKLCEKLDMLKIKGKRGRHVPIILTPDLIKAMDILFRDRCHIGFLESNKYFFATRGEKYLRGHDVLNEIVSQVDLNNAAAITSTNLRKYVATVTQIVSLEKEELEWVADHLGHNIEVHRSFYRLQESTLEVSKVSKLLLAIESGNTNTIAGKKLSDITIEHCFPDESFTDVNSNSEADKRQEFSEMSQEESSLSYGVTRTDLIKDTFESVEQPQHCTQGIRESKTGNDSTCSFPGKAKNSRTKDAKRTKRSSWDIGMKTKVLNYFKVFLDTRKVPCKKDCEKCLSVCKITDHSWRDVKYLVYNKIQALKKER